MVMHFMHIGSMLSVVHFLKLILACVKAGQYHQVCRSSPHTWGAGDEDQQQKILAVSVARMMAKTGGDIYIGIMVDQVKAPENLFVYRAPAIADADKDGN